MDGRFAGEIVLRERMRFIFDCGDLMLSFASNISSEEEKRRLYIHLSSCISTSYQVQVLKPLNSFRVAEAVPRDAELSRLSALPLFQYHSLSHGARQNSEADCKLSFLDIHKHDV